MEYEYARCVGRAATRPNAKRYVFCGRTAKGVSTCPFEITHQVGVKGGIKPGCSWKPMCRQVRLVKLIRTLHERGRDVFEGAAHFIAHHVIVFFVNEYCEQESEQH